MQKAILNLIFFIIFSISVHAQTKKDGTPDMRYSANKAAYGTTSSSSGNTTPSSSSMEARPVYSGQTHTESHGGTYPGSINAHHKGGHYLSPTLQHVYGIHKTSKN